jgi:glycine betaine/proline transport system ATP-binding protein
MDEPKISIRNVYKIFGADPPAMVSKVMDGMGKAELLERHGHVVGLQNINIDMQAGDITVIMGLSGSGKSTLIRHVNGLIKPTAGEIYLDGKNVAGYTGPALRELRRFRMSMVFQNFALMPHMRVHQNVELPQRVRGDDGAGARSNALDWIERLGLKGFENHYPHQLSGGMQQRVGIARALASNSDVMLMDEAFSALDPLIRTDMQNLLLELQRDLEKTIVFITHDLDESLKIADHLVILKDGIVVQQGDPQDIILSPADAYVRRFVNDVNRGRVLRAESVMLPPGSNGQEAQGQVDVDDNLESVIARSGGDPSRTFVVLRGGSPVGILRMLDVFRALIPNITETEADVADRAEHRPGRVERIALS